MCMVIDFNSYKNKNAGTGRNFAVASNSSSQHPVWQIDKEKINQAHAFIEDKAHKRRKYAPDPIKDINDIHRIYDYFISKKQYRNLLLFTMGINFGLRCGDLLKLKFGHIMNIDGTIKNEVFLVEEKNKNNRTCLMNKYVFKAATLYVDYLFSIGYKIDLNNYLFTSLSNNNSNNYYKKLHYKIDSSTGKPIRNKKYPDSPIGVDAVEDMLKKTINDELGIDVHAGTHLMRKTFAYHVIMKTPDNKRDRAIEILQKILGHKSSATTLYYAGITNDEIFGICQNLYGDEDDFCYGLGLNNSNIIKGCDVN